MNTQYGTGLWTTFVWVGVECCVAMRHSLERGVACCGVVWHAVAWCGMLRMLQQLCRFSSYPSWFSRKKPLRAWGALIYALNSRLFSGYPLNTFTQVLQQSHGLLSWKIYMYIYIYIYKLHDFVERERCFEESMSLCFDGFTIYLYTSKSHAKPILL